MPIQALLVDDEPLLCQHLQAHLARLWPELVIAGVAHHGGQALALLDKLQPQIIFLDIQMPQLDGLALATQLAQLTQPPLLVFVTAFDQYALAAIEHEAVDYLLKPVQEQRLINTINRLKKRLQATSAASLGGEQLHHLLQHLAQQVTKPKLSWIKAMRQDQIFLLSPADIHYFQAEDKYTTVVTAEAEYIIRTPIKDLREQLDEQQFIQVRRGTLVNSRMIDNIQRDFSGRLFVCLKNSELRLQVGRNFVSLFRQM
jgi:DNA-binding LytR/AlgR family response regulator